MTESQDDDRELDEDGNYPGLPTFETIPKHKFDEEDPERDDEEIAQAYQDRWDESPHGDRAREIFEELGGETGNGQTAKSDAEPSADAMDALLDAIKKSSWWVDDEYREGTTLSKAPGIWQRDNQVPEYVREILSEVINNNQWDWDQFESLSTQDAQRLREILEDKMTQPQGWSVESLSRDIERELNLSEDAAVGVAADTSHNVLATAREEGYKAMEGSEEFVYDWIGPSDHRTTEVCREIKAEVESRGGAVTMPTLRQIARQKAQKYEGTAEGGTPQRVDVWEPHYQCRHVLVREVQ